MRELKISIKPFVYANGQTELKFHITTPQKKHSWIQVVSDNIFESTWERIFDSAKEILKKEILSEPSTYEVRLKRRQI